MFPPETKSPALSVVVVVIYLFSPLTLSGSQCRLSSKFGAPRHRWRELLEKARHYNVPVVGVSFHVGSGCRDASRYEMALKDAREVFDVAAECGHEMSILDIGGGFPGETHGE